MTSAHASEPIKALIAAMKPALEASLDPVAVVDGENRLIFCNVAMKSFLGLRGRELSKKPVLCDHVKIAACQGMCQVLMAMAQGESIRLDESPAMKGEEKIRLSVRVVPLMENREPVGAVVTLRDSTAEIVLQAKYHKLLGIVAERGEKIRELDDSVKTLRMALKKARMSAIT